MKRKKSYAVLAFLVSAGIYLSGAGCSDSLKTFLPAEPTPVAAISREVMAALGSGTQADIVWVTAGLLSILPSEGNYRFRIEGSTDQFCDVVIVERKGAHVIQQASFVDKKQSAVLFNPVPDKKAIKDFQIVVSGQNLGLDQIDDADLLNLLGQPQTVKIETVSDEERGQCKIKTATYQGLEIVLLQLAGTEHPSQWGVIRLTSTDPAYMTTRGLKIGMAYPEVLRLLGTGEFNIYPDDLPNPQRVEINKTDLANDGEYAEIYLLFSAGRLSSIELVLAGP